MIPFPLVTLLFHLAEARAWPLQLQVPVPPTASALDWLLGQQARERGLPSIYFSSRQSSAPSTQGMEAAGCAAAGIAAVAGDLLTAWSYVHTCAGYSISGSP